MNIKSPMGLFAAIAVLFLPTTNLGAQNSGHIDVLKNFNYKQPATPTVLDN